LISGSAERATIKGSELEWLHEVRRLARQRDAIILAHNYQRPEIQDVADHVGDSLALSRIASSSISSTIVFAGVFFTDNQPSSIDCSGGRRFHRGRGTYSFRDSVRPRVRRRICN
jgi:hypothetical protein